MNKEKQSFRTYNLGCKVNRYELDATESELLSKGAIRAKKNEGASICVVNTCCVTKQAEQKSRRMINKAKRNNPGARIIVTGCYAELKKLELEKDIEISAVVGNNQKSKIAHIALSKNFDKKKLEQKDIMSCLSYDEYSSKKPVGRTRIFLKIQDGCNMYCSYCIIPYTRGKIRSRKKLNIINEVHNLVENSYKEIVLTGIHLSSYGLELKDEKIRLIDIIEEIAEKTDIKRIRLGSLEPKIITRDFVDRLVKIDKICPQFHLSLQSGSDKVLKLMKRRYDLETYKNGVAMLRESFHKPAITTDIICGFPGESKRDFDDTVDFVKTIEFSDIHVFSYSKRTGTPAAKFDNQVEENTKSKRTNSLIKIASYYKEKFESSLVGETDEVLIEKIENGFAKGYSKRYVMVAIPDNNIRTKDIYKVKLKEISNDEMRGEIYE